MAGRTRPIKINERMEPSCRQRHSLYGGIPKLNSSYCYRELLRDYDESVAKMSFRALFVKILYHDIISNS